MYSFYITREGGMASIGLAAASPLMAPNEAVTTALFVVTSIVTLRHM